MNPAFQQFRSGPVLGLALAAGLAAQQDPTQPTGLEPQTDRGIVILPPPSLNDLIDQDTVDPDGLSSSWMQTGGFQGFPVFPPNLGGYGQYPTAPGQLAPSDLPDELPPVLSPGSPDWPTWIKNKQPSDLPYDVNTAVLVRQSDRVWVRAPGDDAFVPLYHWDMVRPLAVGSDVRVRTTGDFLVHLFGGGRVLSTGTADLGIRALGETGAHLAVAEFTRLELFAYERGVELDLPDGSTLIVDPIEGAATAGSIGPAGMLGVAQVTLERALEPGRYAGRAVLGNTGNRPVRWRTPLGERTIAPGQRASMFLSAPTAALSAGLVEDGVTANADGPRRQWTATGPGAVTWSGARFELGAGDTLTIDPMLGDPFAPAVVSAPEAPAAKRP